MGKLIKQKDLESELREEISEMGSSFGTLLKFDATNSKYTIDNNEVAVGREYIAHVDQYARGFVKFVDKRPVDVRVTRLGEGIPPKRDDLDDLDLAHTDDDPWVSQRYIPLEDAETGEVVVFVGKSVGAKIALERLLGPSPRDTTAGIQSSNSRSDLCAPETSVRSQGRTSRSAAGPAPSARRSTTWRRPRRFVSYPMTR